MLGKPFPLLVAESSFQKALSFLVELRTGRPVFDLEIDLPISNNLILAHCVGLSIDDGFLIMVGETRSASQTLFAKMMGITNEQTDLQLDQMKAHPELIQVYPGNENELYNELSKLNNELVTLQRELAKKNVELEHLNAEVKMLATVDDLTHVYNRRGFFEIGRREIARAKRFEEPLAAIMIDLDNFKEVNDTYGHAAGDQALEEVAARLGRKLRKMDILGRYGGDEFFVLLPATDAVSACSIAERLRRNTANKPIRTEHGFINITISLGIAVLKNNTAGLEELMENADQALFMAKTSGHNKFYMSEE